MRRWRQAREAQRRRSSRRHTIRDDPAAAAPPPPDDFYNAGPPHAAVDAAVREQAPRRITREDDDFMEDLFGMGVDDDNDRNDEDEDLPQHAWAAAAAAAVAPANDAVLLRAAPFWNYDMAAVAMRDDDDDADIVARAAQAPMWMDDDDEESFGIAFADDDALMGEVRAANIHDDIQAGVDAVDEEEPPPPPRAAARARSAPALGGRAEAAAQPPRRVMRMEAAAAAANDHPMAAPNRAAMGWQDQRIEVMRDDYEMMMMRAPLRHGHAVAAAAHADAVPARPDGPGVRARRPMVEGEQLARGMQMRLGAAWLGMMMDDDMNGPGGLAMPAAAVAQPAARAVGADEHLGVRGVAMRPVVAAVAGPMPPVGDNAGPEQGGRAAAVVDPADQDDAPPEPTSGLWDLIVQDLPCRLVFSGDRIRSCQLVEERCRSHPHDVTYTHPRGRQPLHEAAARCACLHVLRAIVETDNANHGRDNAPMDVVDGGDAEGDDDEEDDNNNAPALPAAGVQAAAAMAPPFHGHAMQLRMRRRRQQAIRMVLAGAANNNDNNAVTTMAVTLNYAGEDGLPIHLYLHGLARRHVAPAQQLQAVNLLLQPEAAHIAGSFNWRFQTPLHILCTVPLAMANTSALMRKLLLEAPHSANKADASSCLPLHLLCMRRDASVEVVQQLVVALPEALVQFSGHAGLAIHCAARCENSDVIQALLELNAATATRRVPSTDLTPLHILCEHSSPGMHMIPAIQALMRSAPTLLSVVEGTNNFTPLHLLCRSCDPISVAVLHCMLAFDTTMAAGKTDRYGYTPLHYVCELGHGPAVVQALLNAHLTSCQQRTLQGDTPLALACSANMSVETIRLLLAAYPEACRLSNEYGYTPLHLVCAAHQPKKEIVQLLLEACPECVTQTSRHGLAALHVLLRAYNANSTGHIPIIAMLQKRMGIVVSARTPSSPARGKVDNTPLHVACFRRTTAIAEIATIAMEHPDWVSMRNNAGYTPLQILCKNDRLDERLAYLLTRIGGTNVVADSNDSGYTILHAAMHKHVDAATVRALLRACPEALQAKSKFEETPLHLAAFHQVNKEVLWELVMASSYGMHQDLANSEGRVSPVLIQNMAGQTPMSIVLESFQRRSFGACVSRSARTGPEMAEHDRAFENLGMLVKLLHYGPSPYAEIQQNSLVRASIACHRRTVRLDPIFIRRALALRPDEAMMADEAGNFPLHVEASIPIEKMQLLNGTDLHCCAGRCNERLGILQMLLDICPDAVLHRNLDRDFPLCITIQNGRPWDRTFAGVLRLHPDALHWAQGITPAMLPFVLQRLSTYCGKDTMFSFVLSRPSLITAPVPP